MRQKDRAVKGKVQEIRAFHPVQMMEVTAIANIIVSMLTCLPSGIVKMLSSVAKVCLDPICATR
jgi:hypothetical protein